MSDDPKPKPSDQMPEDAPDAVAEDDVAEAGEGAARESGQRYARETPGPDSARDTTDLGYRDSGEADAYDQHTER
jgi:hypothetical protein